MLSYPLFKCYLNSEFEYRVSSTKDMTFERRGPLNGVFERGASWEQPGELFSVMAKDDYFVRFDHDNLPRERLRERRFQLVKSTIKRESWYYDTNPLQKLKSPFRPHESVLISSPPQDHPWIISKLITKRTNYPCTLYNPDRHIL